MQRETLLDFFADLAKLEGDFLVWDDGYRTHHRSYSEVARGARAFAEKLRTQGIGMGAKIVFWSENRPEWVAALWGCLLEGAIAVPIDFRSSPDFVKRVAGIVEARAVLTGDSVDAGALRGLAPAWPFANFLWGASERFPSPSTVSISGSDIAQIVFTSGATAEPKGVIITHRNLLANIVPVENEVRKYRRYERPFHPIRFLNLLPLSHLFGQTLATFIPPMIAATVVFQRSYHPEEIVRQIRSRRISVLVSVPKILEVLRDYILREFPETREIPEKMHWARRWWHFRRVHRAFGFKFWALITGAAPLDPSVETFFRGLGFVVIQGYGLTETAPIVTLNHPFHTRAGTVGTPVGGVEVKLAGDGEVLVRGGNVSRGYFGEAEGHCGNEGLPRDAWLATGDIGEMDAEGRLSIRGRKKEMIVLSDGRKVFPEDVETVLRTIAGVRDCAVIGPDQVHAVLVTEPGAEAEEIVARVNRKLEDQQKIRAVSIWPAGEDLPRTAGTGKLKRSEIRDRVLGGLKPQASKLGGVAGVLQRYAPGRAITPETNLDELGLSSLDRVQLLIELEQQAETAIDEGSFTAARTVADLTRPNAAAAAEAPLEYPAWNRSWWARGIRSVVQAVVARPLTRYYARLSVTSAEQLQGLSPPVIFAPNHQSFMDVPAVLCALPAEWRGRVAPAMAKEWFEPHFHPSRYSRWRRLVSGLQYYSAALFYNAFPIPQRELGARQTLRYMGSLMDAGFCVLIFPEGDRTRAGELLPFRPGTAMLASQTRVPVVPVRLEGLEKVFNREARWPSRGRVKVTFGAPLTIEGDDYAAATKRLEDAVRQLG
jgi:long-chain acyl-CoA synthetase